MSLSRQEARPLEAFVLVQTIAGCTAQVGDDVENLPGIDSVEQVSGPYDLIARVHAPDVGTLDDLVSRRIGAAEGVVRWLMCPVTGGVAPRSSHPAASSEASPAW